MNWSIRDIPQNYSCTRGLECDGKLPFIALRRELEVFCDRKAEKVRFSIHYTSEVAKIPLAVY
jgi:hypothetical protein